MKKLINKDISEKARNKIVYGFNNVKEEEIYSTIESILTEKMKQTTDKKYDLLSEQSNNSIENKFMIVYQAENSRIYLHALQKGDDIVLENPLLKEVGKRTMSIKDLVESDKVIGIYGTTKLVEKLKELKSKNTIKIKITNEKLADNEDVIVDDIKNSKIEMPNAGKEDNSIEKILKGKNTKPRKNIKR